MKKTTSEIFTMHHQNVFIAERLFAQKKLTLEELGALIPGYLQVNHKDNLALQYVNDFASHKIDISAEEIINLGASFFDLYLHPDTFKYAVPKFLQFYNKGDGSATHCEFQKIRSNPHTDQYDWYITFGKISKEFECIIAITHPLECIGEYADKIAKMLDDNMLLRQQYERFATLTRMEKEVLRLLALGHRNKDIAEQFYISPHTVRTHRNKIHEKLDIRGKNVNHVTLYIRYAEAFGLI